MLPGADRLSASAGRLESAVDILTVGDLEERVAVVDELMKDDKITFLQDYTARKKKEVAQHGEEPENA